MIRVLNMNANRKTLQENIEAFQDKVENYKLFIENTLILNREYMHEIFTLTKSYQIGQSENRKLLIIFASNNTCEACFTDFLSLLIEHNIEIDDCFLCLEEKLFAQNIWIEQGFSDSHCFFNDSIFAAKPILNHNLVIFTSGPFGSQKSIFIFDPKVDIDIHSYLNM